MNEEKRNRVAAAITVNVILLIVILAVVVIYQLAVLSSARKEKQALNQAITEYNKLLEDAQNGLDYLKSYEGKLEIAIKEGYGFKK